MKSILQSIHPQWCELIASGKKTIEVRKTKPKIPTPFKCYVYCTKEKPFWIFDERFETEEKANGKVIGEYICDEIKEYPYVEGEEVNEKVYQIPTIEGEKTCLDYPDFVKYANGKTVYFWHISDLKIYDKPKYLSEFYVSCNGNGTADDKMCIDCPNLLFDYDELNGYTRWCGVHKKKPLTRPPQSWCYVEEV